MLPDVLLKIKKWIKNENLLSESQLDELITKLSSYEKGKIVYPGTIKRHLGISIKEAYRVLFLLQKNGVLEVNYEVYCHACDKFQDVIFKNLSEIPDDLDCQLCRKDIDREKDLIVVFRVV